MQIFAQIQREIEDSRINHGSFTGSHEGYAVLLEEVDELWSEIKKRERNFSAMEKECIQIAAMAVKFIEDICCAENDR